MNQYPNLIGPNPENAEPWSPTPWSAEGNEVLDANGSSVLAVHRTDSDRRDNETAQMIADLANAHVGHGFGPANSPELSAGTRSRSRSNERQMSEVERQVLEHVSRRGRTRSALSLYVVHDGERPTIRDPFGMPVEHSALGFSPYIYLDEPWRLAGSLHEALTAAQENSTGAVSIFRHEDRIVAPTKVAVLPWNGGEK